MQTTFVDRSNTNRKVFRTANTLAGHKTNKNIKPFSTYMNQKAQNLLGHVIRDVDNSFMRKSILHANSVSIKTPDNRRVGRPRQHWTYEHLNKAWSNFAHNINESTRAFDLNDPVVNTGLMTLAQLYYI